jgi:peptidoglycan hydrolase-like protein with peptidoglycan-binding domain
MRRVLVIGSAAVVAAASVTAAAIGFGGSEKPPRPAPTGLNTEPVTRATLRESQQVNGTLGYGAATLISAHGSGTLTWLPRPGRRVGRGQVLYRTDNRPVMLFYGTMPLYRTLHTGDSGPDVREVETNLAALGYRGFTVDATFSSATATAVRRWQGERGLVKTGQLDPASVVVAPGRVRVATVIAHLGDPAGGPVLTYAGTTRVVTVALEVALQSLVRVGGSATITLPDSKTVSGRVAAVGTVVTGGSAESGGAGGGGGNGDNNQPPTIDVTITIADQSKLGTLDQAPVVVDLVSGTAENVLTVPVVALVALAEGGYGVQVVDGSTSHYVGVELGMFADGRVQVSGAGVTEGMRVAVPR